MTNWFKEVLECDERHFSEDGQTVTYCKKHADELHSYRGSLGSVKK